MLRKRSGSYDHHGGYDKSLKYLNGLINKTVDGLYCFQTREKMEAVNGRPI